MEGFIAGGLAAGESAIIIATPAHLGILEQRLRTRGIDTEKAREQDHYIALDAEQTLGLFMNDGWPDDERFYKLVRDLLGRARESDHFVYAGGLAGCPLREIQQQSWPPAQWRSK